MRMPHLGIRARTTLAATVVVGVVLVGAAAGLVLTLRYALHNSIRAASTTRASDVALLARSGHLPASLPGRGETYLVQVLTPDMRVIAASGAADDRSPLARVALAPGATRTFELPSLPDADRTPGVELESAVPFLVTARGVSTPTGTVTVLAAASLGPLEDTSDALLPLLLVGVPLVLAVVAVTTWMLSGVALRPVASIRAEAEAISSSVPERRLPVPAAQDEIRDLAETMNRMLDRIESASLAHRRFSSDASHELKSPIASMRTMLEVARLDPTGVVFPELLDDLLAEDLRLELLVSDLLLLAQSDEGHLRLNLAPVDLARLIAEESGSIGRDAVQIDTTQLQPITLQADTARLRQVLRNLLDNASRHASSAVWVSSRMEDGRAAVLVSDDGRGIGPGMRERVFDRFVRLDDGRGRTDGGTGLGLCVSREIARAHGGDVAVVEPLHGGATLQLTLPAACL